jgi:hypothetical protein
MIFGAEEHIGRWSRPEPGAEHYVDWRLVDGIDERLLMKSRIGMARSAGRAGRVAVAVVASIVTAVGAGLATAGAAQADDLPAGTVSIDAGGTGGGAFLPDSFFTGGAASANASGSTGNANWPRGVAHPIPQAQWNDYRFLETGYSVPGLQPGGSYQLRLYFLEWFWPKAGQRVFDVAVNGEVVLKNFDIIKAVVDNGGDGCFLGIERAFDVVADATGTVTVDFHRGPADQPAINAIVLAPTA